MIVEQTKGFLIVTHHLPSSPLPLLGPEGPPSRAGGKGGRRRDGRGGAGEGGRRRRGAPRGRDRRRETGGGRLGGHRAAVNIVKGGHGPGRGSLDRRFLQMFQHTICRENK
jgi:hypothetical protein